MLLKHKGPIRNKLIRLKRGWIVYVKFIGSRAISMCLNPSSTTSEPVKLFKCICSFGSLPRLNEIMSIKCLVQCLVHCQRSIDKSHFFLIAKSTALVTGSLKCLEESMMSIRLNAQFCGFSFSGKKVLSCYQVLRGLQLPQDVKLTAQEAFS